MKQKTHHYAFYSFYFASCMQTAFVTITIISQLHHKSGVRHGGPQQTKKYSRHEKAVRAALT